MRKLLALYTLTLLAMTLFSGCAEQAVAPEVKDTEKTVGELAENEADDAEEADVDETEDVEEEATEETETEPFDQLAEPVAGDKVAVIETDLGTIKVKLFTDKIPGMTKNFEELAKSGTYNNVPFHRVAKDFMIQTGDFTNQDGTGGYSYNGPNTVLPDEISPDLKHLYGTVSMANRGPNTNGSQFFIVTNKNGTAMLNGGYTVFGQVYEGMDVAEKIADLQKPGTEVPSELVNMVSVEVMELEG